MTSHDFFSTPFHRKPHAQRRCERSPSRISSAPVDHREQAPYENDDADLILPFGVLWLASIARAGACLFRHETATVEATLAMLAIFLLPYLLRGTLLRFLGISRTYKKDDRGLGRRCGSRGTP